MEQLLPRGFALSMDTRVKRMVASGDSWQIYTTNINGYALALKPDLFHLWTQDYRFPEGVFLPEGIHPDCRIIAGSRDYMIASMEQGPYPGDTGQVEAFSVTFKKECDKYPLADMHDAIYIEEFSRLMPVSDKIANWDRGLTYGKWLCAGVHVSVKDMDRMRNILNWMPGDALERFAKIAGFAVAQSDTAQHAAGTMTGQTRERTAGAPVESGARFVLTGRPALEEFFNDHIIDIVLNREAYERMGISFPGATILHGPPGCGKTFAVERLCEYLGWPRFDIDSASIGSTFIHDTSKKIAGVFQDAIQAAPSILVIDEMEAFLSDRGMASSSGTHHIEEVAEFLRRIPEANEKGVLIFAMTNMLDKVDNAITRRGRFDHIIEVGMPSAEEVESLLRHKLSTLPADDSVDIPKLSASLANHPMSDVTFVLREAGRSAVKSRKDQMDMECFENALKMLPKQKEKNRIGFL